MILMRARFLEIGLCTCYQHSKNQPNPPHFQLSRTEPTWNHHGQAPQRRLDLADGASMRRDKVSILSKQLLGRVQDGEC
jgi:hypothetical protein